MTNRDIDTSIPFDIIMAQPFFVNSAFRLYPVGQATGIVGTYVVQNNLQSVTRTSKTCAIDSQTRHSNFMDH